jgi:hypothetical protein
MFARDAKVHPLNITSPALWATDNLYKNKGFIRRCLGYARYNAIATNGVIREIYYGYEYNI